LNTAEVFLTAIPKSEARRGRRCPSPDQILLELPFRQGYRIARTDALAEAILASPHIQSVLTKTSKALAAALVPARNHAPQRPGHPDTVRDFLRPGWEWGAARY